MVSLNLGISSACCICCSTGRGGGEGVFLALQAAAHEQPGTNTSKQFWEVKLQKQLLQNANNKMLPRVFFLEEKQRAEIIPGAVKERNESNLVFVLNK